MDDSVEATEEQSGAMNRRRLLQGAAVAGVGVAVWSVPNITSLGATPAYASVCTSGFTDYELGSRNTSCNCGDPQGDKYVRFKELGTPCAGGGNTFPGSAALTNGPGGAAINDAGKCPQNPSDPGDNAGVTATPTNPNLFCKTVVRVYQGGSCGNTFQDFSGPVVKGPGFYPLPKVVCQGGANIFISVIIRCSIEEECL